MSPQPAELNPNGSVPQQNHLILTLGKSTTNSQNHCIVSKDKIHSEIPFSNSQVNMSILIKQSALTQNSSGREKHFNGLTGREN